jgi:hypothetical protein
MNGGAMSRPTRSSPSPGGFPEAAETRVREPLHAAEEAPAASFGEEDEAGVGAPDLQWLAREPDLGARRPGPAVFFKSKPPISLIENRVTCFISLIENRVTLSK